MNQATKAVAIGIISMLSGCGGQVFTATGPKLAPRQTGCDFRVLTTAPSGQYEELGVIDVSPGAYGINATTKLNVFKGKIAEHVCAAGGNAALVAVNGLGFYIKATVLDIKQ